MLVAATSQGVIDPLWLDLTSEHERVPLFPETHKSNSPHAGAGLIQLPAPGKPVRYESPPSDHPGCGWIFSHLDQFDEGRLMAFAGRPEFTRLKGVFQLEDEWIALNKSGNDIIVKHSAYRRDSRVEIFAKTLANGWGEVETELLSCFIG